MNDDTMIILEDVTKKYGGQTIFRHFNFTIPNGKTLLIGPNGTGKTTLLSMMCGLKYANSGKISCFSFDTVKDIVKIRNRVSYVPSEGDFPLDLTLQDLLNYAVTFSSQNLIENYLSLLDIESLLKKQPKYMSSGEKKLVRIAFGLFMKRSLLILDEPLINIDKRRKYRIMKLLDQENANIILTSHSDEFIFSGQYNLIKIKKINEREGSRMVLERSTKKAFKIRVTDEEMVSSILKENSIDFEREEGEFVILEPTLELFSRIFQYITDYRRVITD